MRTASMIYREPLDIYKIDFNAILTDLVGNKQHSSTSLYHYNFYNLQ